MTDFLFARSRRPDGELSAVLERFIGSASCTVTERHGAWGSVAVAQRPHEPDSVVCDDAGITVLAGSPVARFAGMPPRLVHEGTRRRLLHERCTNDMAVAHELDGAFAALCIDVASGAHRLITDRFAFIPLFRSHEAIGTHVDAVARATGAQHDLDPVSILDLAANLSCTPPWTLYRGIEQVAAAVDGERTYWSPAERDRFDSLRQAADALREGMVEGVRAAIGDAREAGVLLSAGEDSRAVLGAMPEHVAKHAFTWADWESREVRIARAVARAYGATHHVGMRRPDHYAAGFDSIAPMLGSHHSFIDVHGFGLSTQLGLDHLPLVIGGLSADSLLKRNYAEDEATPWRSTRLPGVPEALHAAVDERRAAFREALRQLRPRTSKEWMWVWPMALRKHGGNVDGNRRMFRSWEAFHATAVLEVAAATPAAWKERRRLFHAAVKPLLARSWWLPHGEYRIPYFSSTVSAALLPALAVGRGIHALRHGELRVRHRPWPKWRTVAGSPLMLQRERELLARSALPAALGVDALTSTQWYSLHRMLFTQLALAQSIAAE